MSISRISAPFAAAESSQIAVTTTFYPNTSLAVMGDLLVVTLFVKSAAIPTTPAGWTKNISATNVDCGVHIFTRVCPAIGESNPVTFSLSLNTTADIVYSRRVYRTDLMWAASPVLQLGTGTAEGLHNRSIPFNTVSSINIPALSIGMVAGTGNSAPFGSPGWTANGWDGGPETEAVLLTGIADHLTAGSGVTLPVFNCSFLSDVTKAVGVTYLIQEVVPVLPPSGGLLMSM
jgi:hypothetical protein